MIGLPPIEILNQFADDTSVALNRLSKLGFDSTDLSAYLPSRLAAVLVLLYEQAGHLRVLLTTRSKHLRSHPGQTALPGGRVDPEDKDSITTAFREAYEEVSLPLNSPSIYTICSLEPHISQGGVVVTPVVAFLADTSLLDSLKKNEDEVDRIFNYPLEAVLDPAMIKNEPIAPQGSEDWPYETEFYNWSDRIYPSLNNTPYRMHRFRSAASPVKGLTSDILIIVATTAYERLPVYERFADGQIPGFSAISEAILSSQVAQTANNTH